MNRGETLLVRADASPRIGTGHIMRCLALAQGWRRAGGEVVFGCAETTLSLEKRLETEGFVQHRISAVRGSEMDAEQTARLARNLNAGWVAADGYVFGYTYQRTIKEAGLRLLLLDDYGHAERYCADIVLNQNLSADEKLYAHRDVGTRLLLGTRYALLREEFLKYRDWERDIPTVARKVLVTLGGSDPGNAAGKVIEALRGLDVEAKIVVGGSNLHAEELRARIGALNGRGELIVDAPNMPELMAWADAAVSAGGSTCWELAFMGLPSLLIVLVDNQVEVATALLRGAVSVNLGEERNVTPRSVVGELQSLMLDSARRAAMSRNGRQLVDGFGTARTIMHIGSIRVAIRRAEPEDCRQLWEWVNDPAVRASAFSSTQISWEDHQCWFHKKLHAPDALIMIGVDETGMPVGQVRFECDRDGEAVVDVSVDPKRRRVGIGSTLIRRAVDYAFETTRIRTVHAHIKPDNTASIRAFQQAGFRSAGRALTEGQETEHFVLVKNDG